jgi:hypothetical protein
MKRRIRWVRPGLLQVDDLEPGRDGVMNHALYYRRRDGSWDRPLPPDIELPDELARSISRSASSRRPYWQLHEPEPWRLRR